MNTLTGDQPTSWASSFQPSLDWNEEGKCELNADAEADADAETDDFSFQIFKKSFWQDHLYDVNYDGDFLKSNEYICYLQVYFPLSYSIKHIMYP